MQRLAGLACSFGTTPWSVCGESGKGMGGGGGGGGGGEWDSGFIRWRCLGPVRIAFLLSWFLEGMLRYSISCHACFHASSPVLVAGMS